MNAAVMLDYHRQATARATGEALAELDRRFAWSVGEYVVARHTLRLIAAQELFDFEAFLSLIESDRHELASDLQSEDKVAWVLRAAQHIELQIQRLVQDEALPVTGTSLAQQIDALTSSRTPARALVPALHVLRQLRNASAHSLQAGRTVTAVEADTLYEALPPQLREEVQQMTDAPPADLNPMWLAKICCVLLQSALEGVVQTRTWGRELQRVLPLSRRVSWRPVRPVSPPAHDAAEPVPEAAAAVRKKRRRKRRR